MTLDHAGGPVPGRRRLIRSRSLAVAAAAGVTVLLAAGCSGGGGGGSPVAGTITIAAVPGVDDAPLWLAQQDGLFTAAGLHVKINTVVSDSAAVAAVENGQAQIAASDYGNILAWQAVEPTAKGLHLLADAYDAGSGNVEILVHGSAIKNPTQLSGKYIGIPSELTIDTNNATVGSGAPVTTVQGGLPSSLDAAAATQEISDYLLDAPLVLKLKSLPEAQEISELQSGKLAAAVLTQPYAYQAEATYGDIELTDVYSGQNSNLPLTGYVSLRTWARSNSAAVTDFQSALDNAQTQASTMGPIQRTLESSIGMTQADADMVGLGTYPASSASLLEISRVATLMKNAGVVEVNTAGFLQSLLNLSS